MGCTTSFCTVGSLTSLLELHAEAFLKVLEWDGKEKYLSSKKTIWRVEPSDKESLDTKTVGRFSYVIVRGAGHIAPYDQPRPMNDLVDKLVTGKPLDHDFLLYKS